MQLRYRSFVEIDSLAVGECTIHRAYNEAGARWWNLWFYVARETDGEPVAFVVPVLPSGAYTETGPGGRTWGLTKVDETTWVVSPSINIVVDVGGNVAVAGIVPDRLSLWHQTPEIVGVNPLSEGWATGASP